MHPPHGMNISHAAILLIFPADDPQAELMTQVLLSNAPEGQILPEHPVVDQEELKKSYFVINEGV